MFPCFARPAVGGVFIVKIFSHLIVMAPDTVHFLSHAISRVHSINFDSIDGMNRIVGKTSCKSYLSCSPPPCPFARLAGTPPMHSRQLQLPPPIPRFCRKKLVTFSQSAAFK